MKYIITPFDPILYKDKSVGLLLGTNYSAKANKVFSIKQINYYLNILENDIYLNFTRMFEDSDIIRFKKYVRNIDLEKVKGIIIGDIGLFKVFKAIGYENKLIYYPDTLLTNYIDFSIYHDLGFYGAFTSKEITLDDIKTIYKKKPKNYNLFFLGHGNYSMFYSKRKLLTNFNLNYNTNFKLKNKKNLCVKEPSRDELYPILEDRVGTYLFRTSTTNSFSYLKEVKKVVDYFLIDLVFKNDKYGLDILNLYNKKKVEEKEIINFKNKYHETWDNGFLDIKTYYKKQGE